MNVFQSILQKEIGTIIPGLEINGKPAPYGVLNERAVRASAGIMFLVGMITFFIALSYRDVTLAYPTVILFWVQFFITVFFGPKYAPISVLGRLLVANQKPEYVGAVQKRFAWALGLAMASLMLILTVGFGLRGMTPMIICTICLALMWLETAVGYCVGCSIYNLMIRKSIVPSPEHKPACPGGVCEVDFSKK